MQLHIHESNQIIQNKIFSGAHYAKEKMADGTNRGTFRSYSVLVDGDNICFKNCVFENTAGCGKDKGQAIALYLDGDNISLENCLIKGHQDTLFLAPLPDKEIIPGGFIGPKQFTERKRRTYYFLNCVIEGGVDFIFGGATAYFENCEFISIESGYVFAPSTPSDVNVGFVAKNCRFTSKEGVEPGSCYIARPWRNDGYVRLENCYLGEHINSLGFDDWGKIDAHLTVRFFEYNSSGPGASINRPSFVNSNHDTMPK
jgi:pectinesterase